MLVKFVVTAFCLCVKCVGSNPAHQFCRLEGRIPIPRVTVACEYKYIGKIVEIPSQPERFFTCETTGSGINSNQIDIFVKSHEEALQFGRRRLLVRIK